MTRPALLLPSLALFSCLLPTCGGVTTPPTPRDPGVIQFEGALGNRFVKARTGNEILARLRVATRAVTGRQADINLGLVIDTSGSMEGGPSRRRPHGRGALLDSLRPGGPAGGRHVRFPDAGGSCRSTVLERRQPGGGPAEAVAHPCARARRTWRAACKPASRRSCATSAGWGSTASCCSATACRNDESPLRAMAQAAASVASRSRRSGSAPITRNRSWRQVAQLSGGTSIHPRVRPRWRVSSATRSAGSSAVLRAQATITLTPGPPRAHRVRGRPAGRAGGRWRARHRRDVSQGESLDLIVKMTRTVIATAPGRAARRGPQLRTTRSPEAAASERPLPGAARREREQRAAARNRDVGSGGGAHAGRRDPRSRHRIARRGRARFGPGRCSRRPRRTRRRARRQPRIGDAATNTGAFLRARFVAPMPGGPRDRATPESEQPVAGPPEGPALAGRLRRRREPARAAPAHHPRPRQRTLQVH